MLYLLGFILGRDKWHGIAVAHTILFATWMLTLGGVYALTARLTELKAANPDIAIVIRPDRELPVQKLIGLMDAVQRAGITKVGIATRAESK